MMMMFNSARRVLMAAKKGNSLRFFSNIETNKQPVKVGDKFPSAIVAVVKFEPESGFTNEVVDINEYFENKNIVLVGYPGAFTPTCMSQQIPQFIGRSDEIKAKGADEIVAVSVNDPFVVTAFAELLAGRDKVTFIADGNGELT